VLSITFHIPRALMLLGVILRGCAFAFRHYDAVRDRWQRYYSAIFVVSSFLTPLMLGVIAGGMLLGAVAPIEQGFHAAFIGHGPISFAFQSGCLPPFCSLFSRLSI
jgi:cytochrome bd ubiquinol oxidase subunit II